MQARAKVSKIPAPYKSDLEVYWAAVGPETIAAATGQAVVLTMYEPLSFNLPGSRYTPDFLHILADGEQCFVEVKGSKSQRGYRDARAKLRAAADVFPFYSWFEVRIARRVCDLERLS